MDIFELAKNLKSARIAAKLTQADLAERTGVSLSTISALERGSAGDIGVAKLEQLMNATGFELTVKPKGQRRTLDALFRAKYNPDHAVDLALRQRVRKSGKKGNSK